MTEQAFFFIYAVAGSLFSDGLGISNFLIVLINNCFHILYYFIIYLFIIYLFYFIILFYLIVFIFQIFYFVKYFKELAVM